MLERLALGVLDVAAEPPERALELGGSFYLTYHRWARDEQVRRAYPGLAAFVAEKRRRDPEELIVSDWWRYLQGVADGGDER